MNRNLKLCLILVIFAIIIAETHQSAFPVGKQYSYDFSNDVFIKDFKNGKPIAYRTAGVFKVANILDADDTKLLKLTLESPQLNVRPHGSDSQTEFHYHESALENYQNSVFYGLWKQGNITDIYVDAAETVALVNVKKSLASLFQYQTKDGNFNEIRTSGVCKVTYQETSPTGIQRIKQSCKLTDNKKQIFIRPEKPLQASLQSHRSTDYEFFANGTVKKIDSRDYFHIALEANRNVGGTVDSIVVIVANGKPDEIDAVDYKSAKEFLAKLKGYKGLKIEGKRQIQEDINKINIRKLVKDHKKALATSNVGTLQSAKAFLMILSAARYADKEDVVQILESKKLVEIKPQLLDILGTAQTEDTHAAVVEVIDFTDDSELENIERYLQALAIGTRPNAKIIADLLKIVDTEQIDEKIATSIIHALGSMAYRYAHLPGQNYSSKIVKNVLDYFKKSMSSCDDQQPSCYVKYINGLNNLQSAETIKLLFDHVKNSERAISVAAMKALRRLPPSIWDPNHIQQFENIFFQIENRTDSSVRVLALDILLDVELTDEKLNKFLGHLKSNDRSFEIKKYLLEKLMMLSEQNVDLNDRIQAIIRNNRTLNNYDILNPKGLSNALSRKYSIQSPFNGTMTSLQEIFKGILKSGVVDLTVDTENDRYSYFTLGLYAGGLTSFMGISGLNSQDIDDIDDDTANAGMEITVQGAFLRPLEFFRGQSELMGHVWSGTASEPIPAYVANSLLHDHHESFQLQNGATVSVDVESALSVDLNGAIQMSLWNRNAQIQVDNNAGLFLKGKIRLNAGFVSLDLNFNVETEPKLNLNTYIDFSSENMLCMQPYRPNDVLKYEIQKNQIIPEIGHHVRTTRKITHNVLGSTLFLNKINNEMCNKIFSQSD